MAQRALIEGCQPISTRTAYEAGRRVGCREGIDRVRQAIINMHSKDEAKDDKL